MAHKYKITVKNGEVEYEYENGSYQAKTVDGVYVFENLSQALAEFFQILADQEAYPESKVSLAFVPDKKSKKNKN